MKSDILKTGLPNPRHGNRVWSDKSASYCGHYADSRDDITSDFTLLLDSARSKTRSAGLFEALDLGRGALAVGDLEANRGGTVPLKRTVARNHVVENCTQ